MNKAKLYVYTVGILFGSFAFGQNKGITYQSIIKNPSGVPINIASTTINVKVLSKNGCILREEEHINTPITNGYLNLSVLRGTRTGADPNLIANKVFDNSSPLSGLTCINTNGSINGALTSYTPLSEDTRKLRISFMDGGNPVVADFNIRSSAFAFQAEQLNGKSSTDFINVNPSLGTTQTNVESVFQRYTKLDAILNNFNSTATSIGANITGNAATSTNFTGALSGDVTGTQGSTSVIKLQGRDIANTVPTNNYVLTWDGATNKWTPKISGTAPVTSVAGRTGDVVITASDIPSLDYSKITTGIPSTISGYGITDAIQNKGSVPAFSAGNDAAKPAAPAIGQMFIATDTEKIYRYDGATWQVIASNNTSSGTISQVTAGTGLSGGGTSGNVSVSLGNIANNRILANTSGAAAAPVATDISTLIDILGSSQGSLLFRNSTGWTALSPGTSGQLLQTQGAAANPSWVNAPTPSNFSGNLSGDVSGAQSSTSVDKIKGTAVSSTSPTTSGQALRYNGAQWAPGFIGMQDLRSTVSGANQLASSCSANQTLTYNSVGDIMQCSNISITVSQVSDAGSLASKNNIDLSTSDASGTLPITKGGTGTTTGSITGSAALTFTAGGTNSNVNLVPQGTGTVDVATRRISSVGTPTAADDAATKAYVDAAGGSAMKEVTLATTNTNSFPACAVGYTQLACERGNGYTKTAGLGKFTSKSSYHSSSGFNMYTSTYYDGSAAYYKTVFLNNLQVTSLTMSVYFSFSGTTTYYDWGFCFCLEN